MRGAREPVLDALGLPTGEGERDTLITWTPPPSTAPPASFRPIFFEITTSVGAEVSHLSIDGARPPGGNTFAMNNPGPTGIRGRLGSAYDVRGVRLVRMEVGIKSQGATGRVRECYLGDVGAPFQLHGGLPDGTHPAGPKMVVRHNRIEAFRIYGMVVSGGGFEGGTHLDLVVEDNDFQTPYDRTGPSNPAGLRISPAVLDARYGLVRGRFASNSIRGPVPYPIMIHAGQPQRLGGVAPQSGDLYLSFEDTLFDEAAAEGASIVTFTNARATELPCELNPPTMPPCSGFQGALWWAYLTGSIFDVRHSGELDVLRIDHPELDPFDGTELGNLLLLNGEVTAYQTFVIVP